YGFEPLIISSLPQICLGDPITLMDLSVSDTNITLSRWFVGENTVLDGNSITLIPEKKGWFEVSLYLRNQLMCDTTIHFEKVVLVGDTLPTEPNSMLHVSVIDDHSLQVKYLRSTELDFDKYFI